MQTPKFFDWQNEDAKSINLPFESFMGLCPSFAIRGNYLPPQTFPLPTSSQAHLVYYPTLVIPSVDLQYQLIKVFPACSSFVISPACSEKWRHAAGAGASRGNYFRGGG